MGSVFVCFLLLADFVVIGWALHEAFLSRPFEDPVIVARGIYLRSKHDMGSYRLLPLTTKVRKTVVHFKDRSPCEIPGKIDIPFPQEAEVSIRVVRGHDGEHWIEEDKV